MRTLQLFISLFFLVACNEHKSVEAQNEIVQNSRNVTIKLLDSLGSVSLSVPNRYDTFFEWHSNSDCYGCGSEKYRWQPSNLRVSKESGFYYPDEPKDSIERTTLSYSEYHPFKPTLDSNTLKSWHKQGKENYEYEYKVVADSIENINGRLFSIIVIDQYDTAKKQFIKKVMAVTTIRGNELHLRYELLTRVNDSICKNFINNSRILLRTVKFSNGI